MRISRLLPVLLLLAARVVGQNVMLTSDSDANLTALITAHHDMLNISLSFNPMTMVMSQDSTILQSLSGTASAAESSLRAVTDLLGVYDNLHDAQDKAMMRPLLDDRLRLYSRLLDADTQKASLPLTIPGAAKEQATNQSALGLRDALRSAKAKVDAAVTSLQ
jgi:hypothetical protein